MSSEKRALREQYFKGSFDDIEKEAKRSSSLGFLSKNPKELRKDAIAQIMTLLVQTETAEELLIVFGRMQNLKFMTATSNIFKSNYTAHSLILDTETGDPIGIRKDPDKETNHLMHLLGEYSRQKYDILVFEGFDKDLSSDKANLLKTSELIHSHISKHYGELHVPRDRCLPLPPEDKKAEVTKTGERKKPKVTTAESAENQDASVYTAIKMLGGNPSNKPF